MEEQPIPRVRIVCPYCGMSTWIRRGDDEGCCLPGCEGYVGRGDN